MLGPYNIFKAATGITCAGKFRDGTLIRCIEGVAIVKYRTQVPHILTLKLYAVFSRSILAFSLFSIFLISKYSSMMMMLKIGT